MKHAFKRDPESGLIVVRTKLNQGSYQFKLLLDTGATFTTIDSVALYVNRCMPEKHIAVEPIETSNGVIKVDVFAMDSIEALGITRKNVQIQSYDFYGHGIRSSYDGLLGLDFFEGTRFTVDMIENTIEIF